MKHIHETWAFLVKFGILRTSVYNVYRWKPEWVCRTCHKRIHSAHAQSWAKWASTTDYHICGSENYIITDWVTEKPSILTRFIFFWIGLSKLVQIFIAAFVRVCFSLHRVNRHYTCLSSIIPSWICYRSARASVRKSLKSSEMPAKMCISTALKVWKWGLVKSKKVWKIRLKSKLSHPWGYEDLYATRGCTILPYFGNRKQVIEVKFLVNEQNVSVISIDVKGISWLSYPYISLSRMSMYAQDLAWKKSTQGIKNTETSITQI